MRTLTVLLVLGSLVLGTAPAQAETKVCVKVDLRLATDAAPPQAVEQAAPGDDQDAPPPPVLQASEAEELLSHLREARVENPLLPLGQSPVGYLKRLLEHFVTHEPGFLAVAGGCDQHLDVEMYPLQEGWTVFARYSANEREERVDRLLPNELSQFAERAATALLHDVPISTTIQRDTVLEADSVKAVQTVHGTSHVVVELGTQLRGGVFDTAQGDGAAEAEARLFSPMTLSAGYRGKFESWGIEAMGTGVIGTSREATRKNPQGGHVDFQGGLGTGLHVLRYLNPRGIGSLYLGAGGSFELLFFGVIKANNADYDGARSTMTTGGMNVDLVAGYEFLRTNSVQFLLQGEVHLPAYVMQNSDAYGAIHTWFPGLSVNLGVVF
jgi:hypothetical protein